MGKTLFSFWVRVATLSALLLTPARNMARADQPLFAPAAVNVTDMLGNVRGGRARGASILDKADLTATYLGDDHHHQGLSVFLDAQIANGSNFNGAQVGAAQDVSSLDGPAGVRLANAWVAEDFDGQAGLKAGIVDLNTEFDVQPTAALFLNSAFGIGPDFSQSGENGPSIFPSTGLGLVGSWLPGGHWQLKSGVFEGVPGDPDHPGRTSIAFTANEGALLVFEARNHLTANFVVGAGAWRYTASFDAMDPAKSRSAGNSGVYAIADGQLYVPDGAQSGLSGWVRTGIANGRFNAMDATFGAGLVYTGFFDRPADQAGISIAHAHFAAAARLAAQAGPAETTVEATYSFSVNSHLTIQPDIQFVMSPAGNSRLGNALVLGSRITLTR